MRTTLLIISFFFAMALNSSLSLAGDEKSSAAQVTKSVELETIDGSTDPKHHKGCPMHAGKQKCDHNNKPCPYHQDGNHPEHNHEKCDQKHHDHHK